MKKNILNTINIKLQLLLVVFMLVALTTPALAQKMQTVNSKNGIEVSYIITTNGAEQVATFTVPTSSINKMAVDKLETIVLYQQDGFIYKHNAISVLSGAKLQVNSSQLIIDPNATMVVFSITMVKKTEENRNYSLHEVHLIKQ